MQARYLCKYCILIAKLSGSAGSRGPGTLPFVRRPVHDVGVDRALHDGWLDLVPPSVACDVDPTSGADRAAAWGRGDAPTPVVPGEAPACAERAPWPPAPGDGERGLDRAAPGSGRAVGQA